MNLLKKYKYAVLFSLCLLGLYIGWPEKGFSAAMISLKDARMILTVLPPVLLLIGLFDVWVPRETVIRYMGAKSGVRGLIFAFILGAMAAGPLFVAFPIAAMLASKGARLANILFFIGIWSTAKLPMLLFEISFMGKEFTFIHVSVGIIMFLAGSFVLEKVVPETTIDTLQSMVGRK